MNDNNAADTTPVNDTIGLSNVPMAHDLSTPTHSSIRHVEGQQRSKHILVVEDDPTLATLEAEILSAHGYTVMTVQSGELAIAALRCAIPDLVVLDLELIGTTSGWDVLHALRAYATIPVLITSSSMTAIHKYMRQSGETRLTLARLPKPYPIQTLLRRIKRMLPITPL